jgi:hypothetical protein
LGGQQYGLLFDLNAIDEIQDRFDIPISDIGDLMKDERKVFKVLKAMLTIMINEAIDDENEEISPTEKEHRLHVTERFIGRKIQAADIANLKDKVLTAFKDGTPEAEEEDPNPKSA